MEIRIIGVLSPGDMGHAIARVLQQHGLQVITSLRGRSPRTAALAAAAGMVDVADDETLVREADVLLSILPPAQAYALAERIARAIEITHASLLFADCNAIAPQTVQAIEQLIVSTGAYFADVGIIGGPPRGGQRGPRLYASGPHVSELALLAAYGLDIRVLGPQSGQASGLKMCYASLTKGLTALAGEALTTARALGLSEAFSSELRSSQGTLLSMLERQLPSMPPKAYRWVGEMEEIAKTFADVGLPPQMLEGAAAFYRFVQQTELGTETPEARQRGQTLDEVTVLLAAALAQPPGND